MRSLVAGPWGWLLVATLVFFVGAGLSVLVFEGALGRSGETPSYEGFCCGEPMQGQLPTACSDQLALRPDGIGRFDDQCELPDYRRTVRQTWNTWSNLPFFLFGLLILLRNAWVWADEERGAALAGVIVGAGFLLIGVMSSLFHARMTAGTQGLDILGIYVALFALLAATIVSSLPVLRATPWAAGPLCLGLAALGSVSFLQDRYAIFRSSSFIVVLALLIGGGLLLRGFWAGACEGERSAGWWLRFVIPLVIGLGLVLAGVLLRDSAGYAVCPRDLFDVAVAGTCADLFPSLKPSPACNSCTGWGPHAWWHVLAAAGLFLVYEAQAQRRNRVIGV